MSQQADKPTVIFVPGAFHTPAHYEPIISQLKKLSSPSLAVSLPTIGTHASTAGLAEDIQVIRSKLEEMVNQEARDVVLVAHSYGGNPVCQAVKGFEKSERTRSGQSGGIIHCIFINALLFAEGESIVSSSPEGSLPPWAEADVSAPLQYFVVLKELNRATGQHPPSRSGVRRTLLQRSRRNRTPALGQRATPSVSYAFNHANQKHMLGC